MGRFLVTLAVAGATVAAVATTGAFATHGGDVLVSNGSPSSLFSQNKQNEPALAVDANHPSVLVAGANDNIDMEACNAGTDNTCPFTAGIGGSGVYFSFNSGDTWTQPTYTGLTARGCTGAVGDGDPACTPVVGPIGTLPWYYENGLVSDGDPALAFGPKPDSSGHFSWSNGSRLYYANLTSNLNEKKDETFKGFEAIAVSRTDDVAAAAAGVKAAWMPPVVISKQSSATFSDKEQLWADNAESSPFFGNVYVCYAKFVGNSAPMEVAVSRDGGGRWKEYKVSPAHNAAPPHWGQSGCTVRTTSTGVVYVFYEEFQSPFNFLPPHGTHFLVKSFDGGNTWTKPQALQQITDPCFSLQFDGSGFRCVMDGVAGARDDLSSSPSVDIANGAPTGAGATNEIVRTWVDAGAGLNNEHVFTSYSTNGGNTWSAPAAQETVGDRGYYTAVAISPDGTDAYLVYNAFTTPFRNDTTSPRNLVGVVKHADIGGGGAVGAFATLHRGANGDPRASSQNNLWIEFLGDYVYAVATNTYGAGVWNDVRNGADCPAIDAWRASAQAAIQAGTAVPPAPAPQQACPATFGNTDIFGGSYADPTP